VLPTSEKLSNVEPLSIARTKLEGFFSILLGILAQDVERLTARRPVAAMYPCSQQNVQTDAGHRTSVDLDKPNSSHLA
jgi:hypothetical protein